VSEEFGGQGVRTGMRCFVISGIGYPSASDPYRGGFIHSRIRSYASRGVECLVFVPDGGTGRDRYLQEEIPVASGDLGCCLDLVRELKPDRILVHFISSFSIRVLRAFPEIPAIIWIHGFEALSWRRRLYNFTLDYPLKVARNIVRRRALRRYLSRERQKNVLVLFVSRWMQRIARSDVGYDFPGSHIVPNPIDADLFRFTPRSRESMRRILVLRPFSSRKYATDIAMKTIRMLLSDPAAESLRFTIYGAGRLFARQTRAVRGHPRVAVHNRMLQHAEMPGVFADHGVLLIPTRQDAQGVTMCEAMMSGMVPVTSPVDAIPEFVDEGESGLMGRTARNLARHLIALARDGEMFTRLSDGAHAAMMSKAAAADVTDRELAIIAATGSVSEGRL
jgi:L-malate glycosyltransferase